MPKAFHRNLYHLSGRAISDFLLIEEGDVILIGASGGKDSMVMAHLLADFRKRAPVGFTLLAATIDNGGELDDDESKALGSFFANLEIPHTIVGTEIAKIIQRHPTTDTACSLCANLRRGALHKTAQEVGANKVALGYHLDDAIETLFLNMFYQGSLRCFEPRTYLTRRRLTVIRPLIYIPEEEIEKARNRLDIPVLKTRCPFSGKTHRQAMKDQVSCLARDIPGFRNQMRGALRDLWSSQQKV